MRRKRNRRQARKQRPYSKNHYVAMATRIQQCFRDFCGRRYSRLCVNYGDTDFISMNPVGEIPRDLLFVTRETGFDARELWQWMLKTNTDPISREPFSDSQRLTCVRQLRCFVNGRRQTQAGKRGFFSRYRAVIGSIAQHGKRVSLDVPSETSTATGD